MRRIDLQSHERWTSPNYKYLIYGAGVSEVRYVPIHSLYYIQIYQSQLEVLDRSVINLQFWIWNLKTEYFWTLNMSNIISLK